MNQTVVSLASAATIGSAMLLWKLLTGESTDTDTAVGQDNDYRQTAQSDLEALHVVGVKPDEPNSLKVELSGTWTDASSQCADDGDTTRLATSTSSPDGLQHKEDVDRDTAGACQLQHPELQLSDSYASAASLHDSLSDDADSLPRSSNSPSGMIPSAIALRSGANSLVAVMAPELQQAARLAEEDPLTAAAGQIDGSPEGGSTQPGGGDQQQSESQQDVWSPSADGDLRVQKQQSRSHSQQSQSTDMLAVSPTNGRTHPNDDAADNRARFHRQSSHEQMLFGPVEPRVCFGALLGQWEDRRTSKPADAAERSIEELSNAQAEGTGQADALQQPTHDDSQCEKDDKLLEVQEPLGQRLVFHKLQPLNFAGADNDLDAQYAMTDEVWASLRTVEVCHNQQDGCSPSDGHAAVLDAQTLSSRPASTAAAVGITVDRASSTGSEDVSVSAFASPLQPLSAAAATSPTSSGSAGWCLRPGHSRQPSNALSEGGGALGAAGDWPSIHLQGSVLADAAGDSSSSQPQAAAEQAKGTSLQCLSTVLQHQMGSRTGASKPMQQQPVACVKQETKDKQLDNASVPLQQKQQSTAAVVDSSPLPANQAAAEQQQQQPVEEQQAQQHSRISPEAVLPEQSPTSGLVGNITAQQQEQQQLADTLLPPTPEQHQLSSCAQHHHKLDQQSMQAEQQQHGLLPEFTVPTESMISSSSSPGAASNILKEPSHLHSRLQQAAAGQLVADEQQQKQPSSCQPHSTCSSSVASSAVHAGSPAGSRHSARALLLQTVDAGAIPHAMPAAAAAAAVVSAAVDSSQFDDSCLMTQPLHSSRTTVHELVKSDLAAGLTAARSWRSSRSGFSSLVGGSPTHSKLPLMTTPAPTADKQPDCFRASLQQQLLQQQQQALHKPAELQTGLIPSSSGSISSMTGGNSSNDAAGLCHEGAAESSDHGAGDVPWLRLVVSKGPAAGRRFETSSTTEELVIGRNPTSWASIPDEEVSGKHAYLSWSGSMNCWQLADAGSLNGTTLNDTVISRPGKKPGHPTALKDRDELILGSRTHAVVECGPADQQDQQAAVQMSPAVAHIMQQQQQQQQQQPPQASHSLQQTLRAPSASRQQQQQQHKTVLDSQSQRQQYFTNLDDRYSTWTSGLRSPGSSSSGSHRRSFGSPPTATATRRPRATASCLGNSSSGSATNNSSWQSQLQTQVHSWTGACRSQTGSSNCYQDRPCSPSGASLAPPVMLQFPQCRVQGAVAKVVGADHRRNDMPCEDVVAWRTPLADWPRVGLFCVFDGHHSRCASEQAQELLPKLLAQHLLPLQEQQLQQQQQQQPKATQQQLVSLPNSSEKLQQCSEAASLLTNESGIAAALRSSFLETDQQLACDDGCTATAVLLEGCPGGSVMLRVANVGDSMALLVDVSNAGWRSLTEDHRIAGNPAEAARLTAKNHHVPGGVSTRLYGLNIARMLGDSFLKQQDVGFTAEPYISEGIVLGPEDEAVLLVASDGLWDVVKEQRAAAMAAKIVAERAKVPDASTYGTTVADVSPEAGQESSHDGAAASPSVAGAGEGHSTVAALVAEALMQAALSHKSRDDISVMVLHVLPAGEAKQSALLGTTDSGSI